MGRVSRYKKIKSVDPFAKNGSWKSDVGDCATLRRAKRKSRTALRLQEQKEARARRGRRKAGDEGRKRTGGSNGWGDDGGYDLPPTGGDEFDLRDLVGSVKKQKFAPPSMEAKDVAPLASVGAPGDEKWTRKVARVDARGAGVAEGGGPSSRNGRMGEKTITITAKTPTKDIIAACSNPSSTKGPAAEASLAKQEKRKEFLEKKKKKRKKRKRGGGTGDEEEEDNAARPCAPPLAPVPHGGPQTQGTPVEKHRRTSHRPGALVARARMDEPAERPPTFTTLPRGAHKLAKNKKAPPAKSGGKGGARVAKEEGDGERAQRIRKEQQALEAMRERVMKQYAKLRESRRQGGGKAKWE